MRATAFLSVLTLCLPAAVRAHDGPHAPATKGSSSDNNNRVTITVRGKYRYIISNGLPDHATGQFPNSGNPNRIRPQRHTWRVPAEPEEARMITPVGMRPFGVAVNGIPFDPSAAEFWRRDPRSGWQYEALSGKVDLGMDASHAHVQPNGTYHYHGLPTGLLKNLIGDEPKMVLLGYAADGFPIYGPWAYRDADDPDSELVRLSSSYRLKEGTRPDGPHGPGGEYDGTFVQDWEYKVRTGDLDECNGRRGVTPEYPEGTYYYVITEEFPFIPRYFRGTPDSSFERHGPPPGGRRPPRGGPPGAGPRRGGPPPGGGPPSGGAPGGGASQGRSPL